MSTDTPRSANSSERADPLAKARDAKAEIEAARRARIVQEELDRPRVESCSCPIIPESTLEELRALGAGCTAGRWVCPTLDAIRRRLGS